MQKSVFEIAGDMLVYILSIELYQIPYHIAMFAISALVGYCSAMVLIGFPVSVWEHFTKKKVDGEKEGKVIAYAAIFFTAIFILRLLYEKVA